MSETQPIAYVVSRARVIKKGKQALIGVSIPVKVFTTRKLARSYCAARHARTTQFRYSVHRVKQG